MGSGMWGSAFVGFGRRVSLRWSLGFDNLCGSTIQIGEEGVALAQAWLSACNPGTPASIRSPSVWMCTQCHTALQRGDALPSVPTVTRTVLTVDSFFWPTQHGFVERATLLRLCRLPAHSTICSPAGVHVQSCKGFGNKEWGLRVAAFRFAARVGYQAQDSGDITGCMTML
eukprot:4350849-Amphidinium_carterae.1